VQLLRPARVLDALAASRSGQVRGRACASPPRARVVNFADENPTVSKKAWQAFLEALIAEDVPLILVGSTRAGDIVRDADILHLYKRAGWDRFLLGLENTDQPTFQPTARRFG
jgi:hypothetical protein